MLLDITSCVSSKPQSDVVRCGGACKLLHSCNSPIKPIIGTNGILIIGEAPTESEDTFKQGFMGTPSARIHTVLTNAGIDPKECSYTYAIRCHPHSDVTDKEYKEAIESCRILLLKVIDEVKPHTILLFGHAAISSVISYDYGKPSGGADTWVGFKIPSRKFNAWLCPIYSMTMPYQFNDSALDLLYNKYIQEAVKLKERPWKEIPDETKEVEVLYDTEEIVNRINKYRQNGGTIAFDLETSGLKPDAKEQFIYSCSICHMGKDTISFLWNPEVEEAMRKLLQSARTAKVGANIKYDHRFIKAKMGIDIKGWVHDVCLASHIQDCRPNITSLKFQSYVRYGLQDYDSHIKKYFESDGSNSLNKIKECDVYSLLLYGGIDALLTYRISCQQMREMHYPFGDIEIKL